MDANFRLKNQLVSNYSQDPGLGIGLAYMVPRLPYEDYVLSRAKDDYVRRSDIFAGLLLLTSVLDQYVRRSSSTRKGQYEVLSGVEVYRGRNGRVWKV